MQIFKWKGMKRQLEPYLIYSKLPLVRRQTVRVCLTPENRVRFSESNTLMGDRVRFLLQDGPDSKVDWLRSGDEKGKRSFGQNPLKYH